MGDDLKWHVTTQFKRERQGVGCSLLQSHFKWYLVLSKTDNTSVVFKMGAVLQHAVCNPAQTHGASWLEPSMVGLAQTCALTDLPSSASGEEDWGGQGRSPWLQHMGYHTLEITQKRAACAVRGLKAVCIKRLHWRQPSSERVLLLLWRQYVQLQRINCP